MSISRASRQGVCLGCLLFATSADAQPTPPPVYPEPPPAYPASPPDAPYQPVLPPAPYPSPAGELQLERLPYRVTRPSGIYGEILGKGLIYGVGYDYAITERVALGAAFSYLDPATFICPYVTVYPVGGWRSALLLQAGLQLVYLSGKLNDMLEELLWDEEGMDVGGQVSIGYEFRSGFLFRAALIGMFNKKGLIPWPGLTFGGSF